MDDIVAGASELWLWDLFSPRQLDSMALSALVVL
jgi:hypothetical protein